MTVALKIAAAGVVVASIAATGVWLHKKQGEFERLSGAASQTRTRAEQGDALAEYELGRLYYQGKGVPQSYEEAFRWYLEAANKGSAKAQFSLGDMYYRGVGVPKDYAEALRWIQKAADQGDAKAESALGYAYFNGMGLPRDDVRAMLWYRKAADQGYPLAQQALGYACLNGSGVPKDEAQAAAWYEKAARQGDEVAQSSLGYMYWNGIGLRRDWIESMRWYRMAAAHGDPDALRFLKSLRPSVTTRYVERGAAVIGFAGGLIFALTSWGFLLPGKICNWRQHLEALLALSLFVYGGLSLYASAHVVRYLPHYDTFLTVKWAMLAIIGCVVATVVLPAKRVHKKPAP